MDRESYLAGKIAADIALELENEKKPLVECN